jgi:hypothetical protein
MSGCESTERRDPVQLYRLRAARLRWLILVVLLVAILAVLYWVIYLM